MEDEILQPVSQRGRREEIEENRRIYEVSDELFRRSQLYEAQFRNGQKHVGRLEIEQRVAEQYAKENGIWIPMHEVFDLGMPGPSGNENDTYVSNDIVYKVNNLLNSGGILKQLEKISWHNILFYDTFYTLYGFTGFDGRTIMPIFKQRLVKDAILASPIEIDTYMAAIGFDKVNNEGRYANADFEVWDLVPRNVLKDRSGDIYVIDAEIMIR